MSAVYGAIALISPATAEALTIMFVALLLVPACAKRVGVDRWL